MSGRDEPSLEELLTRYRDSDPVAFREFYRRTKVLVFHYLSQRLRNRADAEDVFQETYFRVHRYVGTYDPARSGATWLLSIARNAMIDRLKATRRAPESNEALIQASAGPSRADELSTLRSLFEDACRTMSPEEIGLLFQRVFLESSFEEIAEERQITPANARQRLSRLLRRIKSPN